MKPIQFQGMNRVYTAPKNWDAETMGECRDLPVRQEPGAITSCYELDEEDIVKLIAGKKLYFTIHTEFQPVVGWEIK